VSCASGMMCEGRGLVGRESICFISHTCIIFYIPAAFDLTQVSETTDDICD